MANENVKITISAEDKASKQIKEIDKTLENLGNESKTSGEKIKTAWTEMSSKVNLAMIAFQQVYQTARQFYQYAREGAELEFTASKFDRLTASIGTTADALLLDLKEATDGTMSEMELMGAATDFMTLGLAKSHDEVVRLSNVSSQLGMDMNQLVLTLTNQTTMRFDALGVAVDGFDEKVQKLKDSGMDANAAFTEAFLQQAEEQIAKVGSVTDESIGSFMRLEAAWQDIVAEGKKNLTPFFADVAESFANMLTLIPDNVDQLARLNEQVETGKISYDEYKLAVDEVLDNLHVEIDEQGNLTAVRRGAEDGIRALTDETIYYSEEAYYAALQTQLWKADSDAITIAFGEQKEATEAIKDATNNAEAAMRKYSEALLFKIASEGLSEEAALQLAYKMGLVDEATVYATEKVNAYQDMLLNGLITQETYNALVSGLKNALDGMPSDVNIDLWLKIHNYDEFQRVANSIGSMGGGGGINAGGGGANPIAQASGGDVRPGGSYLVGEHGMEILQMGYNGQGMITPVNTNITNNYNLGVTTMQNLDTVQTGFAILQAMQ